MMQDSAPIPPMTAQRPLMRRLIGVAVLVILLAGYFAYTQAMHSFLTDAARRGDNTLQLAATSLRGKMARFEHVPELIADHAIIQSIRANDPHSIARANLYLKSIQQMLGASDIYVMDADGVTQAASNFDSEISFIGGNFAFRPYFADAIGGGLGRYFALGTTSGKRGYYFGAPIRLAGQISGVVVVKIDLDEIEQDWRGSEDALIVTDPDGVIFLSSRPEWLFTAFAPLTADQQQKLMSSLRYGSTPLANFPVISMQNVAGQPLLTVGAGEQFLALNQHMPEANWVVRVLLQTAPARGQSLLVAFLVMLTLSFAALIFAVILQRRARLAERMSLQQSARNQLERRVSERTAELAAVNARLEAEVTERRLAEKNLRKAQADLIQAGKLAALGQMSAALSHEFNQPLGAARAYADNAAVLLDRGRQDEARRNLDRILSLIDRMTSISKRLHSFARAPGKKLGAVSVADCVEAAVEIAQLRLRAAGAQLQIDLPPDLPAVIAGPVRLQQVLVNLLTNAADAAESADDKRIHLTATQSDGRVILGVRDHGAGVAQGLRERIFDPFFSTKGVGKGLGLGLSISYNIIKDFGGHLRVETHDQGGAVFVIDLNCATAAEITQAAL